jgi:hypothetical protein
MKKKIAMKTFMATVLGGLMVAVPLVMMAANETCYDQNQDIYFCPGGWACNNNWNTTSLSCTPVNYYCCSSALQKGQKGDT